MRLDLGSALHPWNDLAPSPEDITLCCRDLGAQCWPSGSPPGVDSPGPLSLPTPRGKDHPSADLLGSGKEV